MKKKNFLTLIFGVIGGMLVAIGMCMSLLPEWNLFNTGVGVTTVGAIALIALAIIRHINDGKKITKPNWKFIGKIALATIATLVVGFGMCMIMVWNMILQGIIVGIIGIILLLCLIPMCFGLK